MKLHSKFSKALFAGLLSIAFTMPSFAQSDDENTSDDLVRRFSRFKTTPEVIVLPGPCIFTYSGNALSSIRGMELIKLGDHIVDAQVNPFCSNFFIISNKGNNNLGEIFDNSQFADNLYKINKKKMGNPWAVAYTNDALKILVATDWGLFILNAADRNFLDTMPLPFEKTDIILLSSNDYYLAVTNGSKLAVYNLEEKKLRKEWDFEVKINDLAFNDNSSELAVVTEDGTLSIFDTRNFLIKKTIDDLGEALACSYNFDGKYIAVAETPEKIVVINLLQTSDRETIDVPLGEMSTVRFVKDNVDNIHLVYNSLNTVNVRPMGHLKPYYARLINDEVNDKLNDWMKMLPGETMEEYKARVNDESRERQRRRLEDEVSTRLAPDMLSMSEVSLGMYNRANGMLEVDFSNMPSIFLAVPESDLAAFQGTTDLQFKNAMYGVLADDSFELIYAEVYNQSNGKTYIYDNLDRTPLNFMADADNTVSLDLILQQQMEEKRLDEMRQKVVEEAKKHNVISDHTNITVDSRIEPDYDANGKKILNYIVKFSYVVDPEFTVVEDFGPGKYHAEQSGAASAMLSLVKEALEGDFAQYTAAGKKLNVNLSGTADATPIVSRIPYDGSYGDIVEVPMYKEGRVYPMTLHKNELVTENDQLAFLRAYSVKNYINDNIEALKNMNTAYRYDINVSKDKGSEHRRISVEFNFVDAL